MPKSQDVARKAIDAAFGVQVANAGPGESGAQA